MQQNNRLYIIDQMRGIAVLLMAIFHFCYDLSLFNFIEFSLKGGFFSWFRYLILTLFFIPVGASLALAHSAKIQWHKFIYRQGKLLVAALIISVSSYFMYPTSWVWFGVLHFIFIASLLSLPLVNKPSLAGLFGLSIFLLFLLTPWFNLSFLYQALHEPLHLPHGTIDLTRLIPWLGMVYIGIFIGHKRALRRKRLPLGSINTLIHWLGRNSLIVYLVHQLPLYAIAWLLNAWLH
ncbi:heparan-alpha-glucosaminide N-acetyltransferase [Reinekea thalattae]|uniref:DUF1624 domain-containing protein n=1 Tax=Reinekea thalattae TaxID=2593301 RepID=A0A5C8Z706_9GAMM|nr:heparan-alpha-glucosaminide N-acetyltransferase [Reinekea thalattae]TXR53417.1 DUF1624 domain-containing protein [Reinekea thalattae]